MRHRARTSRSLRTAFLSFTAMTALAAGHAASAQTFTPLKPPSVPLITRTPYVNTWLENSSAILPGTWPTYWDGKVKAITGIANIDGRSYLFLGSPATANLTNMTQTALETTSTQSKFTFNAGGVTLNVNFLSPVEARDLKRLSIPLSDIITTAQSSDGASHKVTVYYDISGEWAHGDDSQLINWAPEKIGLNFDGSSTPGSLFAWTVKPTNPAVFNQVNNYPSWGTVLFATKTTNKLTTESGGADAVRAQFVANGHLDNSNDTDQPRPINDNFAVFAFSNAFGNVGTTATQPFTLLLGHVRDPAINFLEKRQHSLWKQYWPAYENMLAFAYNDAPAAVSRANGMDTFISNTAAGFGGPHYAAITSLALRQAFAGTELTGTKSDPNLFLEEISSSDNVSTVDVIYPSIPVFLYTNPELVRYILAPVIYYSESGLWPALYAPHDLGSTYPNASGHNDGGGENMPVEETANMLIMADAYMQHVAPAEAATYAKAHYKLFHQWATYLTTTPAGVPYPNALDPQFQNQTDDFTGSIAHSVNLALKGIEAVGAAGQIAAFAGNSKDASSFTQQSKSMIATWSRLAQNSTSTHLLLQYKEAANAYSPDTTSEPDTYWSLKYNSYPDQLLGLHLIPSSILTEEASFYKTQETPTGTVLDPRHNYTKADWELWTAAGSTYHFFIEKVIDEFYTYANTTNAAAPFPDWYNLDTTSNGFRARPVVGGMFAPLTLLQSKGGK